MDQILYDYYSRELNYLRNLGADFAEAHSEARSLGLLRSRPATDPHIELLLEGVAFLTARVHRKLDDHYSDLADAFLSVIFPQSVQPLPSLAIAELGPQDQPAKLPAGVTIPRETMLTSRASIGGVACQFRTCYDVTLWPIAVRSLNFVTNLFHQQDLPPRTRSILKMGLDCADPAGWSGLGGLGFDRLRFQFAGDETTTAGPLYELFNAHALHVEVRGRDAEGRERVLSLNRDPIRPVGFDASENLLPYPEHVHPGYARLQEFFVFRDKFLYIDIVGLDQIVSAGLSGPVELIVYFDDIPKSSLNLRPNDMRLFTTPIVNLFEMSCEPINLDRMRSEYQVEIVHGKLESYELVSIKKVSVQGEYLSGGREIPPFFGLPQGRGDVADAFWLLNRRPSLRRGQEQDYDRGLDAYLIFSDSHLDPKRPDIEEHIDISVKALCSNRDLPMKLVVGGETGAFNVDHQSVTVARLLTPPTRSARPVMGRAAHWPLAASLSLNYLSLVEGNSALPTLRSLLHIHDLKNDTTTRNMIDLGLAGIRCQEMAARTGNPRGNAVSLGRLIEIELDETAFPGDGSLALLLAAVLESFFASFVTINGFTKVEARSRQRTGVWKSWSPRCGNRTLL